MLARWLVVMAKRPRAFSVKSRLAAGIGATEAVRFYRTNLARLLRNVGRDPRWRTVLAVTPDVAIADPAWPAGLPAIAQGPGDLGDRMQRIMDALPPGPAIIVGSDVPCIRPAPIAEAFAMLGARDVVLAPAQDGGYWLVGLRRRPKMPRIFEGVRWSTSHALADTTANCAGLSVGIAPTLADVDDEAGWRLWRKSG